MSEKRKSNIELLRIVAMLMIIGNHLFRHGVILFGTDQQYILWNSAPIIKRIISSLFLPGGRIGVAIFFIITGYFMMNSLKPFSIKKVAIISIEYGIVFSVVMLVLSFMHVTTFSIATIVSSCFLPLSSGLGWFVSSYILLGLISDRINKINNLLNIKGKVTGIVLIYLSSYSLGAIFQTTYFNLIRGILFYLIGGLIKVLEKNSKSENSIKIKMMYMIIFIISWLGISGCEYLAGVNAITNSNSSVINALLNLACNSVLTPICAIGLFLFFKSLIIKSDLVNYFANKTYAVYLIHDSVLGHYVFWILLFRIKNIWEVENPIIFTSTIIGIILAVFMICSLCEICRISVSKVISNSKMFSRFRDSIYI